MIGKNWADPLNWDNESEDERRGGQEKEYKDATSSDGWSSAVGMTGGTDSKMGDNDDDGELEGVFDENNERYKFNASKIPSRGFHRIPDKASLPASDRAGLPPDDDVSDDDHVETRSGGRYDIRSGGSYGDGRGGGGGRHFDNGSNSGIAGAGQSSTRQSTSLSINALLQRALEEADDPGEGDEEPEVLPDPNQPGPDHLMDHGAPADDDGVGEQGSLLSTSGSGRSRAGKSQDAGAGSDMKRARRDPMQAALEAKRLAIEEEERRVAALRFDENALRPLDANMLERAKCIPLRLTYEERKGLRMVNAAIGVSDYTNVVDVAQKSKVRRRHAQLQLIVSFMTGIVAANSYSQGQEVLESRNFAPYEGLLRDKLEVARRYKITNPEKFRSEYGKLVYLLQVRWDYLPQVRLPPTPRSSCSYVLPLHPPPCRTPSTPRSRSFWAYASTHPSRLSTRFVSSGARWRCSRTTAWPRPARRSCPRGTAGTSRTASSARKRP